MVPGRSTRSLAVMEHPPSFDDGRPLFDHHLGRELVGKHVLVGVTYLDNAGEPQHLEQFHGTVISADAREGFNLRLRGERDGETHWLPPDTRAFSKARPGEYRLKSTGEVVEDPDYTCTWSVTPRKENP